MKKVFAWVLLFVMLIGVLAGCKQQKTEEPTSAPTVSGPTAADAMEYVKAIYPNREEALITAIDYERMGVVRIEDIPFTVVWTTDLSEDLIKIVPSEDGTVVTIDINEQCEADTPYVLTATITDEQGNVATHTWDCILPEAVDMVAIVKEAYALGKGESLPYECTLRGKIININTAYNPEYQNITVTIEIEGAEDMPIECYRLKGEGVDKLQVGNIITVTGTLKNYEGKIEFDAGCIMDAVEKGDAVDAPTDVGEILKAAYKLKDGKSLPYTVELTGTVTEIDNPYDPSYKNISVVIEMAGYSKYPILCYRLKGEEAENIAIGDEITVSGLIKNYKGTIEFDAGCILLKRVSGGGVAQKPSDDEDKILKDAKKLGADEKLPYVATLTGQVFSIDEKYSSQYDNITVTMKVSGTRIQCYHMKGDGVSKIRVGDTITVTGTIVNYKGEKLEFSPATLTERKAGNGKISVVLGPVENDQQYYAEMKQTTLGKNLYLNGQITSGGYLKTTENSAEAVKINVEEVSGKGTRFYFEQGGTKNYIELVSVEKDGETKQRAALVTEPTAYWNYDSELKVYFFDVDGVYCALGTYSNYDTVSATKLGFLSTKNIGKSQFVVKYVTEPSDAPEQPDTPVGGSVQYVADPQVGTAYKFVLNQAGLGLNLGFTGEMSGFYYATSEEIADMVDVYLEETTGGYHIYFMKGNTKTYLNVIPRDNDATKTNVVLQTAAENASPSVYTLNKEFKYVKTSCVGDEWYLGTYSTNKTISASKTSYISDTSKIGVSQFTAWFATIGEGGDTPDTPDTPAAPVVEYVANPVVGTAYKFVMNQAGLGKHLGITGEMSSYYYATTEDTNAMVDVYLEEATGGYHIYFMKGDVKTYLNVIPRDNDATKTNVVFQNLTENATPSVYELNTEFGYVKTACVDDEWYLGTYGTNVTVSASKTSYISDTSKIGVSQFVAWFAIIGEGSDTPDTPTVPVVEYVANPAVGTAYKFVMNQAGVGKQLGITGEMSSYYYATTEDTNAMVDVYLEEATGGYHIYFMKGDVKTYLNVIPRDNDATKTNVVFQNLTENAAPSVYELNTEFKYVKTSCVDAEWYLGTYSTNTTVSASKTSFIEDTSKIGVSQFVAWFATIGQGTGTNPQPPVTPDEPEAPAGNVTMVTAPVAGTAYKLYLTQAQLDGKVLYFNGSTESAEVNYRLALVEDTAAAIDVYLEEVTGGYHLYFMNGDVKTYIRVYERDAANGKGSLEFVTTAPAEVMTYDSTYNTLIYTSGNNSYYMGTYNTYSTISVSNTSYLSASNVEVSQFPAHFGVVEEASAPTGVTMVTAPVAGTAYKLYLTQAKLDGKVLYFNGSTESAEVNYRLALVEDTAAAIDVYLEEANGGFRLYFMNGDVKTYIRVYERDAANGKGSLEFVTTAPAEVMTYDSTYNTLIYTSGSNSYYMGTYNTYSTISISNTSYLSASNVEVSQFPAHFGTVGASAPSNPGNPGGSTPETPVTPPADGSTLTIAEAIAMGTPMEHNTYTTEKYLITGVVDSIEHTVHGNMYIKDEAGNKLYVYGVYDATGTTKYGDMATKPVAGDTVTLLSAVGNYSENAQLKNACLIEHVPSGNPAPEGPVIPEGGVSIDLTVIDNRTAYSHSQQVWEQNGIKLTNNKAGSTTNVGDYCPIRLYKGSETIIEYADMTKVVFDCTNVAAKNVDSLEKSLKATSGITVTRDGQIITVVLPAAADSFTFIASDGQCRTSVVYVYTN